MTAHYPRDLDDAADDGTPSSIDLIKAERLRQIESERWSAEHDDGHDGGELMKAAAIYLWWGTSRSASVREDGAPLGWPWGPRCWKPRDRRSNLVRAGALCLAERDRIVRRHQRNGADGPKPTDPHTGHVDHKLAIIVSELESLKLRHSLKRTNDGTSHAI